MHNFSGGIALKTKNPRDISFRLLPLHGKTASQTGAVTAGSDVIARRLVRGL